MTEGTDWVGLNMFTNRLALLENGGEFCLCPLNTHRLCCHCKWMLPCTVLLIPELPLSVNNVCRNHILAQNINTWMFWCWIALQLPPKACMGCLAMVNFNKRQHTCTSKRGEKIHLLALATIYLSTVIPRANMILWFSILLCYFERMCAIKS